jgi:phage tail-like protein
MPSLSGGDSATVHNFAIQVDGTRIEYLSSISGLSNKQDVIQHVQNTPNGKPVVRKMPGISQGGEVTVTRGRSESEDFTNWIKTSLAGDMSKARRHISIIVMDYAGEEVTRFNLKNAWCCETSYSDMTAGQPNVYEEKVTITYEDLTYGSGV